MNLPISTAELMINNINYLQEVVRLVGNTVSSFVTLSFIKVTEDNKFVIATSDSFSCNMSEIIFLYCIYFPYL